MKKTILYAIIAAAVTAVAVISIVGCSGDFGNSSEEMNGFLERFHYGTKKFTVTYYGNGNTDGTAPIDPNSPYDSGATVKVLGEGTLVKTDSVFRRWNTQSTGSGRDYPVDILFPISGNIKLYAVWGKANIPTYNVEATGSSQGTNVSGGGKYEAGEEVTIDAGQPPAGREFQGWTVISGGISFDNPNERSITFTMPPNDVKAVAVFTAIAGARNWFKDDRDGKEYRTVTIGEQTWMAENLNYTQTSGNSWCYDDNPDNCDRYGRLYDWETAMTVCPIGWHLPSREEWGELAIAAGGSGEYGGDGGTAGTRLKAGEPNWNGTDDYGFSSLPGGWSSDDRYSTGGSSGGWWTASDYMDEPFIRAMYYGNDYVAEYRFRKLDGFSVRCIIGNDGPGYATELGVPSGLSVNETTHSSITLSWSPVRGAVGYLVYRSEDPSDNNINLSNVTTATSYTDVGLSSGTTYYYRVSAYNINSDVSAKSAALQTTTVTITKTTGTLIDTRDGKEYKTATIDGKKWAVKTWMAENLNFTPASGNSWCLKNEENNCDTYGRLYDWATAMDIDIMYNNISWTGVDVKHQGICPTDWHLPSLAEWEALIGEVDGWEDYGATLRSTTGWNYYNRNGTDDYGFSALPGGNRWNNNFGSAGDNGYWWTATEDNGMQSMGFWFDDHVYGAQSNKNSGFSVRCVED